MQRGGCSPEAGQLDARVTPALAIPSMTGTILQDPNMMDRSGGLRRSVDSLQQSEGMSQGQGPSRGSNHELEGDKAEDRAGDKLPTAQTSGPSKRWAGDSHT